MQQPTRLHIATAGGDIEATQPKPALRVAGAQTTIMALRASAWGDRLRANAFSGRIEIQDSDGRWRPLRDRDVSRIYTELQQEEGCQVDRPRLLEALTQLTETGPAHHPVRAWFETLPRWDGVPRAATLFANFGAGSAQRAYWYDAEVPREKYLGVLARNFLATAVARIYEPGWPLAVVPLLVTPNEEKVIDCLRALVPDPSWLSELAALPPDVSFGDAGEELRGRARWIIVIRPSPRGLNRATGFLRLTSDRAPRRQYFDTRIERQSVFVAVRETNDLAVAEAPLLWAVTLGEEPNLAATERDREQLWAEAVALFHGPQAAWALPSNFAKTARLAQAHWHEEDQWLRDALIDWVNESLLALSKQEGSQEGAVISLAFTTHEALSKVWQGHDITKADEMKAAEILRLQLGLVKTRCWRRGAKRAAYLWKVRGQ